MEYVSRNNLMTYTEKLVQALNEMYDNRYLQTIDSELHLVDPLPVDQGGTGASTIDEAMYNLGGVYKYGIRITASHDLNDYITTGQYVCYLADSATILNNPVPGTAFMMQVLRYSPTEVNSSGLVIQILFPSPSASRSMFIRKWYGQEFQDWYEVGSSHAPLNIRNHNSSSTFSDIVFYRPGSDTDRGLVIREAYGVSQSRPQIMAVRSDNVHYDIYNFPATPHSDDGDTANYSILTSRNVVTVEQGGTGSSNPDIACDNLGAVNRMGTEIPANSNLDNYKTTGQFVCFAATSSTITNNPVPDSPFMLQVLCYAPTVDNASGMIIQILTPSSSSADAVYIRKRYGSTFQGWVKIPTLASGLGDVLRLSQGGTGANTAGGAMYNMGIRVAQLASGESETFSMIGNIALVFGKRGDHYILALVDYWTAGATVIASGGSYAPTITHNSTSKEIVITNTHTSWAMAFTMIGVSHNINVS